jgi:hypothetical protein
MRVRATRPHSRNGADDQELAVLRDTAQKIKYGESAAETG